DHRRTALRRQRPGQSRRRRQPSGRGARPSAVDRGDAAAAGRRVLRRARGRDGMSGARGAIADALAVLGVDTFALSIHDASLPADPDDDLGRGSPGSDEAARFFAFARELGFDALQLGPAGETTAGNPSPYDATAFSRAPEALAWAPLVRGAEGGALLAPDALAALRAQRPPGDPGRVAHGAARALAGEALAAAAARLRSARSEPGAAGAAARALVERLAAFTAREAFWLEPYALHDALAARHGCDHRRGWSDPLDRTLFAPASEPDAAARIAGIREAHAAELERYRLGQLLARVLLVREEL